MTGTVGLRDQDARPDRAPGVHEHERERDHPGRDRDRPAAAAHRGQRPGGQGLPDARAAPCSCARTWPAPSRPPPPRSAPGGTRSSCAGPWARPGPGTCTGTAPVIVNAWAANTGTTPVGLIQIGDNAARTMTVNFDHVRVDQSPGGGDPAAAGHHPADHAGQAGRLPARRRARSRSPGRPRPTSRRRSPTRSSATAAAPRSPRPRTRRTPTRAWRPARSTPTPCRRPTRSPTRAR